MKSGDEVFGKFSVLSSLAPADRQALSAYLEESTYEPGQRVYAEGEAVESMSRS